MLSLIIGAGAVLGSMPGVSVAAANDAGIISESDLPLRLHYDEPASHGINTAFEEREGVGTLGSNSAIKNALCDWENWSIPIGNGYFGANLFGRTESERIQITEKTLANPYGSWDTSLGGLNNFSETYIDFGHTEAAVSDYTRELDLETAVSTVEYTYGGVKYSREYFTSYPDKALVIKLTADTAGALDFTLRPTVPYEQSWSRTAGDRVSKTGSVVSSVEGGVGVIELSGKLGYYDVDFLGIYHVYTDGNMTAATCEHGWTDSDGTPVTDTDGTIVVSGATTAYIYVTLGTDYEVDYRNYIVDKPTYKTTLADTREKVEGYMNALTAKINPADLAASYSAIKGAHISDHTEMFGRVSLDLDCDPADLALTTDELVGAYRNSSNRSTYLEVLLFQYGRYLLIASSRSGALPANLQGVWNKYNYTPWSGGFWHNVNIQMNYWPAFSTNLAEVFLPYLEFTDSYLPVLKEAANSNINSKNPSVSGADGGNGWTIGVGLQPFTASGQWSPGHLGFTTVMFYDYYAFTQDEARLSEMFTLLADAARYITKTVVEDEDGNLLVHNCESPEQYHGGSLYFTNGTTYAQSLIYENNYNLIRLAHELGVDTSDVDSSSLSVDDKAILKTVLAQTDRYDPIAIGLSGQVKEFREEDYYGTIGAPQYVHISQLVGLYPGTVINSSTPAWQDAALVSLRGRGDSTEGWGYAHRMNAYARLGEGEYAYRMLNNLIHDSIGNNLWSHYFVYQLDGNCGLTAGVSEMLLQSHEGFIAPLAAIPTEWQSGSYTGLVARGNFLVSAEWEEGRATCFNITSQSGGRARVSYPGITSATVRTSSGRTVSYTAEGGVISFDTTVGETYIISGFAEVSKPDSPATLGFTCAERGVFKLASDTVTGAVSYNLYVAVESAPDYTLVSSSPVGFFTYKAGEGMENARTTFAVTAVDAAGNESERTLAYFLPESSTVSITDVLGGEIGESLQIVARADGTASAFNLYTRATSTDEWTHLSRSAFPVFILDEYSLGAKYAVSAVNIYGEEGEIYPLARIGSNSSVDYDPANLFAGRIFERGSLASSVHTGQHGGVNVTYGYDKLTDGSTHYQTGRFSTVSSSSWHTLDGTVDLGASFHLDELQLYYFNTTDFVGNGLTVEVCSSGQWTRVIEWADHAEIVKHNNSTGKYISVDLGGIVAEQVRVYIPSRYGTSTISYNEFKCTGRLAESDTVAYGNLLEGLEFIPTDEAKALVHAGNHAVYGYPTLTDGISSLVTTVHNGRFSSGSAYGDRQMLDATVDLGREAILDTLRIYDFVGNPETDHYCGGVTVMTSLDGNWTTVLTLTEAEVYANKSDGVISLPMGGVEADKIRIVIPKRGSGPTISLWEIECSGYVKEVFDTDRTALLAALNRLPVRDTEGELNWKYLLNESYDKFLGYAMHAEATQEELDAYTAEINAYADTVSSAILSAYNISLGGDVAMNFRYTALDPAFLEKHPEAYVLVSVPERDDVKMYFKDAPVDSAGRYVFTVHLAACELRDTVTLRAIYSDGEMGKIHSYSVRDYADVILADEKYEQAYPGIIRLVTAMLNYGAAAQVFFDHNAGNLANSGVEADLSTVTEDRVLTVSGGASGFALASWTLALDSTVSAKLYFNLTVGADIADYTLTLTTPTGEVSEVRADRIGDRYRIVIDGITAGQLDDVYKITVTNNTDGTACEIELSATCYLSIVTAADGYPAALVDLARAMKAYATAASEYQLRNR